MNSTPQNTGGGISFNKTSGKKKIWVVVLAMIFCLGLFLAWVLYLSPEAKDFHKEKENIQKAEETLAKYDEMMRNDTYGGKTPEETLNLFVEALKNDDIELASRYFVLELSDVVNEDWKKVLENAKEEEKLNNILSILSTGNYESGDTVPGYSTLIFKNEEGEVILIVDFFLNKYSGVWKIQSL